MFIATFIANLFTSWIPAVIVALSQPNSEQNSAFNAVTSPATAPEAAQYLANFPTAGHEQFFTDWGILTGLSFLLSLVLVALIAYSITRLLQVRAFERKRFAAFAETVSHGDVPHTQLRWQRIREQAYSDNEQNWRLAILEADIMLNELLDSLGYRGETMADKMREADRANFNTIDLAWEAHRARNRIAHEGINTQLSSHFVRRIIGLYEQVFHEFHFVE